MTTDERLRTAQEEASIEEALAAMPSGDSSQAFDAAEPVPSDLQGIVQDMTQQRVSGPAEYILYRCDSGRTVKVNENNVRMKLRQKNSDGLPVFTIHPNNVRSWEQKGKLNCYLHESDPNRARWTEMGMPVCTKEGITSELQRERHMTGTHRDSWTAIQRQTQIDRETRLYDMQMNQSKAMSLLIEQNTAARPVEPEADNSGKPSFTRRENK